jgi:hypothetical protein
MSARGSRPPARGDLGEKQIEALTVAMVVAPGVYVRNRMFDLFSSAGAKRARTRAGIVRGILPQLARATAVTVTSESRGGDTAFVLRYVIVSVSLTRLVELSAAELAALRLVAERAGVRCLPPGPGDKELVARTLARLLDGSISLQGASTRSAGLMSQEVSRLARDIVGPPVD